MSHDVFISHSSDDKNVADALCAALESLKIRCWIAPRDVAPGADWASAIIDAITGGKILVLVFSKSANTSAQIMREVERAVHHGLVIIPFRIEDEPFSKSLEFFVSACHWLDALTAPLEEHIDRLVERVAKLLNDGGGNVAASVRANSWAYRLGFTMAKRAWHNGDATRLRIFEIQAKQFASELNLPSDILMDLLNSFDSAKDAKEVLANAKRGLAVRNTISVMLSTRNGESCAAAFRFGYVLVNILPQFEFIEMARDSDLPFEDLCGPVQDQLAALLEDGQHIGIEQRQLEMIKKIQPTDADEARTLLITIGGRVDKALANA